MDVGHALRKALIWVFCRVRGYVSAGLTKDPDRRGSKQGNLRTVHINAGTNQEYEAGHYEPKNASAGAEDEEGEHPDPK